MSNVDFFGFGGLSNDDIIELIDQQEPPSAPTSSLSGSSSSARELLRRMRTASASRATTRTAATNNNERRSERERRYMSDGLMSGGDANDWNLSEFDSGGDNSNAMMIGSPDNLSAGGFHIPPLPIPPPPRAPPVSSSSHLGWADLAAAYWHAGRATGAAAAAASTNAPTSRPDYSTASSAIMNPFVAALANAASDSTNPMDFDIFSSMPGMMPPPPISHVNVPPPITTAASTRRVDFDGIDFPQWGDELRSPPSPLARGFHPDPPQWGIPSTSMSNSFIDLSSPTPPRINTRGNDVSSFLQNGQELQRLLTEERDREERASIRELEERSNQLLEASRAVVRRANMRSSSSQGVVAAMADAAVRASTGVGMGIRAPSSLAAVTSSSAANNRNRLNLTSSYLSSLLDFDIDAEDDESEFRPHNDESNSLVESDSGNHDDYDSDEEIKEAIRQIEGISRSTPLAAQDALANRDNNTSTSSRGASEQQIDVDRLASLFDESNGGESDDGSSMPPLEDIDNNAAAATSTGGASNTLTASTRESSNATLYVPSNDNLAASSTRGRGLKRDEEDKDNNPKASTNKRKAATDKSSSKRAKKEETIKKLEGETCCICLELPTKEELSTINLCHHPFCFTCISKWADQENKCPLCKVRFFRIDKVHKPKKRKMDEAGGTSCGEDERRSKRVRHRNQRIHDMPDFLGPLGGIFGSVGPNGEWPSHVAQLLFSGLGGMGSSPFASGGASPSPGFASGLPSIDSGTSSLADMRRQHRAAADRVATLRAERADRERRSRAELRSDGNRQMNSLAALRASAQENRRRMAAFARAAGSTTATTRPQHSTSLRSATASLPHRSPFDIDTSGSLTGRNFYQRNDRPPSAASSHNLFTNPTHSHSRRSATNTYVSGARSDPTISRLTGEEEEEELLSTLSPSSYMRRLHRELEGGSSARYTFNTMRPQRRRGRHPTVDVPPPPFASAPPTSSFTNIMDAERRRRNARISARARAAGRPSPIILEIDDSEDDDVVEIIDVETT